MEKNEQENSPDPEDAPDSKFFTEAKKKAKKYASNPEEAIQLIDEALSKAEQYAQQQETAGKEKGEIFKTLQDVRTLGRMVKAYFKKEYQDVPWNVIVLSIAAIIYFVNPFDLVPDFLLIGGLLDDAAVLAYVLSSLGDRLGKFKAWEDKKTENNNIEKCQNSEDDVGAP